MSTIVTNKGIHLRKVFLVRFGSDILGVFSKKKIAEKFIEKYAHEYGDCYVIEETINRPIL